MSVSLNLADKSVGSWLGHLTSHVVIEISSQVFSPLAFVIVKSPSGDREEKPSRLVQTDNMVSRLRED